MPHTDVALSKERWEEIKSLKVNPLLIWPSHKGTYNVGSNKRKEVAYALKQENRKRMKLKEKV